MQNPNLSTKEFHLLEPDYTKPLLVIDDSLQESIKEKLRFLYGEKKVSGLFEELYRLLKVYYAHKSPAMHHWEKTFEELKNKLPG